MAPAPSFPNAASATANAPRPTRDKRSALNDLIAFFLETGIKIWVRTTGKRIREDEIPWLCCPLGERGRIGTGIYERIARDENLQIQARPGAGLIPDFNALRAPSLNPDASHSDMRHFHADGASAQLGASRRLP